MKVQQAQDLLPQAAVVAVFPQKGRPLGSILLFQRPLFRVGSVQCLLALTGDGFQQVQGVVCHSITSLHHYTSYRAKCNHLFF